VTHLASTAAANPASTRGGSSDAATAHVFVLAGVRLYREGVAAVLANDDRFRVVGAADSTALQQLRDSAPDVVLMEAGPKDAPALVRAIRAHAPGAKVVALGISEEEADVLPLAEAGIAGWVTRDASVDDLREAVASAAAGEALCSPRMAASLLRKVASLAEDLRDGHATRVLTRRQREIVALIDEGLSNKEIARQLSIELPTVKNHVHNILEKLQVSRRGEAAALVRTPRN
jgi:two-component system, NarL family, nitrate/nitrite response regulator NarL